MNSIPVAKSEVSLLSKFVQQNYPTSALTFVRVRHQISIWLNFVDIMFIENVTTKQISVFK